MRRWRCVALPPVWRSRKKHRRFKILTGSLRSGPHCVLKMRPALLLLLIFLPDVRGQFSPGQSGRCIDGHNQGGACASSLFASFLGRGRCSACGGRAALLGGGGGGGRGAGGVARGSPPRPPP
eukprot:COSAG04_NODE_15813_length_519_cov_1.345238_1_plen_122_part_10